MTLTSRIETAGPEQQRESMEEAWEALNPIPDGRHPVSKAGEYARRWFSFTAMLDAQAYESAAMLLVPEGCGVYLNRYWSGSHVGPVWSAELVFGGIPSDPRRVFDCFDAATPALALAAACIRAKESDHAE